MAIGREGLRTHDGLKNYKLITDKYPSLSLETIKDMLIEENEKSYDIPLVIEPIEIISGGMFKKVVEHGLSITYNDKSKQYFQHCIMLKNQGKFSYIYTYYFGSSKNTDDKAREERNDEKQVEPKLGKMIFHMAKSTIQTYDRRSYEEELEYYDILKELFHDVFEGGEQ